MTCLHPCLDDWERTIHPEPQKTTSLHEGRLIVNKEAWKDPWKRQKVDQITMLLRGALGAENKVGIKLNVADRDLEKVVQLIPSITAPTVSPLYQSAALHGEKWFSVESVISEDVVRELIPKLLQNGAVGIIEYPLNKVI